MPKKITNFSNSAELKRYEETEAAFILSTPDFNEYAERIEKWLDEHPYEDDKEVAYKTIKSEAMAEELEKITEPNPARQIYSGLHRAVYNGELGLTIDFIDNKGADVNQRDEVNYGETSLMIAIRQGDLEMIKILLDRGADPMIADSSAGLNSFDCAGPEIREFISNYTSKTVINGAGVQIAKEETRNHRAELYETEDENMLAAILKSRFFWILIGIVMLVWIAYRFGTSENRVITPEEKRESAALCTKWGGSVIYDNTGFPFCDMNRE